MRDLVASVTRPVKELKGFRKVNIPAGETVKVSFILSPDQLAFYRDDMSFGTEPGDFNVYIGGNSRDLHQESFTLTK